MRTPQATIIHIGDAPLNKEQMNSVFAVGYSAPWFRAMLQILDEYRHERIMTGNSFMSEKNEIGMAGAMGAYDILTTVMLDLLDRREKAQ